jgi:hypothetical protein
VFGKWSTDAEESQLPLLFRLELVTPAALPTKKAHLTTQINIQIGWGMYRSFHSVWKFARSSQVDTGIRVEVFLRISGSARGDHTSCSIALIDLSHGDQRKDCVISANFANGGGRRQSPLRAGHMCELDLTIQKTNIF